MAGPKVNVPPVTNAHRLRNIIELRKPSQEVSGQTLEIPRPEVLRTMALGGDESRALLKKIWDGLDAKQKETLVKEITLAMPHPRDPAGISIDASKIFRVFKTGSADEATAAVGKAAEEGSVKVASDTVGKNQGGRSQEGSVLEDQDSPSTSIAAPEGQLDMEAAPDAKGPSPLGRPSLPKGVDPKKIGYKDISKGTSRLEDRPSLESGEVDVEIVSGRPVRTVKEGTGRMDPETFTRVQQGEDYEQAVEANIKFQRETLLGLFGDDKGIAAAIAKADEGDEAIRKQLDAVREMANREHPIPRKPYPTQNDMAGSETPQSSYDRYISDIVYGNPNSAVYQPKRGSHPTSEAKALKARDNDPLENALKLLRDGQRIDRNAVQASFQSPRELAEFLIRQASQSMFEVTPVTASDRAMATIGMAVGNSKGKHPAEIAKEWAPNAPLTVKDRAIVRDQAIERLAREIEARLGSDWGESYKPGAVRYVETDKDYRPVNLSKEDLEDEVYSAPESKLPGEPASTTRDPAALPVARSTWPQGVMNQTANDGPAPARPNQAGVHDPGPYEQRRAEYETKRDEFQRKVRRPSYMQSETPYTPAPQPPRLEEDLSRPVPQDAIDDGTARELSGEDTFNKDEVLAGWDGKLPEPRKAAAVEEDVQVEADEPRPMTSKDSGPDWHKAAYRNYKDGEYQGSSSFKDEMAAYNLRNRNLREGEATRRAEQSKHLEGTFPGKMTEERVSDLVRQIDEVEARLSDVPPEISEVYRQLEAEGITPSQAKALRDKLKELNGQHTASKAQDYALLDDLKERLSKAQFTDRQLGIHSHARRSTPLGGKIKKGKAAEAEPQGDSLDLGVDDEAPVITNRPGTKQPDAPKKGFDWDELSNEEQFQAYNALANDAARAEALPQLRTATRKRIAYEASRKKPTAQPQPQPQPTKPQPDAEQPTPDPFEEAAPEKPVAAETIEPSPASPASVAEDMPAASRVEESVDEPLADAEGDSLGRDYAADEGDYTPDVNGAGVRDGSWTDEPIDPLDSASATPMGEDLDAEVDAKPAEPTPSPDSRKPEEPPRPVEAEAAAKADAEKAPEDTEAARPSAESETIPETTGDASTPKDKDLADSDPVPPANRPQGPTWLGRAAQLGKVGSVGGLGLGAVGLLATIGNRRNLGNATYGSDGRPSMGQMPVGEDAAGGDMGGPGVGGIGPNATVSPADRIRMIQRMNSYIPPSNLGTMQRWN